MKKILIAITLVITLLAGGLFGACAPASEEAPPKVQPIKIVDSVGRLVEVPQPLD